MRVGRVPRAFSPRVVEQVDRRPRSPRRGRAINSSRFPMTPSFPQRSQRKRRHEEEAAKQEEEET